MYVMGSNKREIWKESKNTTVEILPMGSDLSNSVCDSWCMKIPKDREAAEGMLSVHPWLQALGGIVPVSKGGRDEEQVWCVLDVDSCSSLVFPMRIYHLPTLVAGNQLHGKPRAVTCNSPGERYSWAVCV